MHRSASASRTSDEFFVNISPQIKGSPGGLKATEIDQLPTYDPLSDIGKKEASLSKFSENLVHVIPIVLVICAIVLWLFSHPAVDLANKGDPLTARVVEGLKTDGYINHTSLFSDPGTEDLEPPQQFTDEEAQRTSDSKSD